MNYTTAGMANAVGGKLTGDAGASWNGAEIDTRRNVQGKLFFAMQGDQTDGHEYIEAAVEGGCAAVVVSQDTSASVPVIQVSDTRKSLFRLATVVRSQLRARTVIAITGSVGKTTTKDLLAQILGSGVTASPSSFNNDLGIPLTLLGAVGSRNIVVEVGANEPGEIEPLAKLAAPDIAIITSIQKAHLAGFGSIATILQEKTKLLEALGSRGLAIVAESVPIDGFELACDVLSIGESDAADIRIRTSCDEEGCAMLDVGEGFVTLQLLGEHNALNAACAIVAAKHALERNDETTSLHDLLKRAAMVNGMQGRLVRVERSGVTFIDDSYNANPASMKAAIDLFSKISGRRKIMVLGDMLELGEHTEVEHRSIGGMLKGSKVDKLFLVGEAMRSASKVLPDATHLSTVDEDVINRIAASFEEGDVVLLKGSRELQLERIITQFEKTTMKVSS